MNEYAPKSESPFGMTGVVPQSEIWTYIWWIIKRTSSGHNGSRHFSIDLNRRIEVKARWVKNVNYRIIYWYINLRCHNTEFPSNRKEAILIPSSLLATSHMKACLTILDASLRLLVLVRYDQAIIFPSTSRSTHVALLERSWSLRSRHTRVIGH
jgi:hypothetical protein